MDEPRLTLAVSNDAASGSDAMPVLTPPDVDWDGAEEATPIEVLALFKAIGRLEEVVDQETDALRTGKTASFDDFNYRKSHGLLELTRAVRSIDPTNVGEEVRDRLEDLRDRLERNRTMLKTHLDATREISSILTEAIRAAESDGTYSAPAGHHGPPQ
jgi:hypothetical protein